MEEQTDFLLLIDFIYRCKIQINVMYLKLKLRKYNLTKSIEIKTCDINLINFTF